MELFDLTGKVAIVTGGNRGIGFGLARGLAEAGAIVVIANRNEESGVSAATILRKEGHDATALPCDLAESKSIHGMVDEVVAQHGTIDILVNNAATRVTALALNHDEDAWDHLMKVNVTGAFFAAQAVARVLVDQEKGGSIINVSSIIANRGNFNRSSYITSKGALDSLTIALAMEWAPYGIRVNGLAPGSVVTPENKHSWESKPALRDATIDHIPMGRMARPQDMVGPAIFLASEASGYVTGHTLVVDGGWMLAARPMSLFV